MINLSPKGSRHKLEFRRDLAPCHLDIAHTDVGVKRQVRGSPTAPSAFGRPLPLHLPAGVAKHVDFAHTGVGIHIHNGVARHLHGQMPEPDADINHGRGT